GFDDDVFGGYAEFGGVFGVVDGFAAGEARRGGGTVGAGEHQDREQVGLVQIGGEGGDAQVVAAQTDSSRAGRESMPHLVVVPDGAGVQQVLLGGAVAGHKCLSSRVSAGLAIVVHEL